MCSLIYCKFHTLKPYTKKRTKTHTQLFTKRNSKILRIFTSIEVFLNLVVVFVVFYFQHFQCLETNQFPSDWNVHCPLLFYCKPKIDCDFYFFFSFLLNFCLKFFFLLILSLSILPIRKCLTLANIKCCSFFLFQQLLWLLFTGFQCESFCI